MKVRAKTCFNTIPLTDLHPNFSEELTYALFIEVTNNSRTFITDLRFTSDHQKLPQMDENVFTFSDGFSDVSGAKAVMLGRKWWEKLVFEDNELQTIAPESFFEYTQWSSYKINEDCGLLCEPERTLKTWRTRYAIINSRKKNYSQFDSLQNCQTFLEPNKEYC